MIHASVLVQDKTGNQLCFDLLCCAITIYISTEWERGKKEREIAESAFFCRACLVKHGYYESLNRHYDIVLFHSFTTRCQSSNGDITVTLFKSHIQYLLFSPLQQERNANKPYNPHRALTPCHWAAGFILAFVRQHKGNGWNSGPWSQVNFLFIFIYLFFSGPGGTFCGVCPPLSSNNKHF